jgi:hypothetical protein
VWAREGVTWAELNPIQAMLKWIGLKYSLIRAGSKYDVISTDQA